MHVFFPVEGEHKSSANPIEREKYKVETEHGQNFNLYAKEVCNTSCNRNLLRVKEEFLKLGFEITRKVSRFTKVTMDEEGC